MSDNVAVHSNLPSKYGSGFMADMAETFGRLGKNGGLIAGAAFGTLAGAFTLAAGGNSAQAAEADYEGVVPYGETQIDAIRGDTQAMKRSATIETASNIGAASGAMAGAAIGTVIMSGITTLTMAFKLMETAQKKWFRLRGYNLLADVINGVKFVNGIKQTADQKQNAA